MRKLKEHDGHKVELVREEVMSNGRELLYYLVYTPANKELPAPGRWKKRCQNLTNFDLIP
jgi:hypothetical protein